MRQVVLLALEPRQLVLRILDEAIAAAKDDIGDDVAELRADLGQRRFPAAVFRGVMQQRAEGFVFVRAVLEDERGDAEDVGDVGNPGALAALPLVDLVRVRQRGLEPFGGQG